MLTITIDINGKVIHKIHAVNQNKKNIVGKTKYKLDLGEVVYHQRDIFSGALMLAGICITKRYETILNEAIRREKNGAKNRKI
jgi:hypothetical protein